MKLKRSKNKMHLENTKVERQSLSNNCSKEGTQLKKPLTHLDSSKWKLLIVDDEPDIHDITRIALKDFSYDDKKLELVSASSAEEAREILTKDQSFSGAIVDVVMETEEAGLDLVRFIREELGLSHLRIIVRTGQPGKAPERFVIDNYDIDDYKEKTDLSSLKMYTMSRNMIKSYRDIVTIENNRRLLEQKVKERTQELQDANAKLQQENEAKRKLIDDLQEANSQIKTLSGIIPICMHCKEIRDDKGFWNRLELFIEDHSSAKFSHSICDKCLEEHYPDEDE